MFKGRAGVHVTDTILNTIINSNTNGRRQRFSQEEYWRICPFPQTKDAGARLHHFKRDKLTPTGKPDDKPRENKKIKSKKQKNQKNKYLKKSTVTKRKKKKQGGDGNIKVTNIIS